MNLQKDLQKQINMVEIRQIVSEMIYPPYIPPKIRPNIDSLLVLLRHIHEFNNQSQQRHQHSQRLTRGLVGETPIQKLQRIHTSCEKYKLKHQEYHNKYEETKRTVTDNNVDSSSSSKQELWKTRAQVQIFNYHYCVTKESCPFRMEQLEHCWQNFGLENIKHSIEQGIDNQICQREREMVQRCTGKFVESFIRDTI